jgi:hypothetical protein
LQESINTNVTWIFKVDAPWFTRPILPSGFAVHFQIYSDFQEGVPDNVQVALDLSYIYVLINYPTLKIPWVENESHAPIEHYSLATQCTRVLVVYLFVALLWPGNHGSLSLSSIARISNARKYQKPKYGFC